MILYNHKAIYSFEDNDVVIPLTVLEELDHFKRNNDIKNFEAREFIRIMGHFNVGMQEKTRCQSQHWLISYHLRVKLD